MRGRKWPRSKQTEVLESYALSESLALTSRETGVPKSTVARWVKQNGEEIEGLKKRNQEIAARAIEQSLEERMKEISDLGRDLRAKVLELLPKVRRASPSGIATLARAAVEVELRGLGKPSEILELRGRWLDAAVERELEKLARAAEEAVPSRDQ